MANALATCAGRFIMVGSGTPRRQDAMVESVDEGERLDSRAAQPDAKRSGEGALSALARLQQQRHSRDAQSPREPSDLSSAPDDICPVVRREAPLNVPDAGSDARCPDRAPRK